MEDHRNILREAAILNLIASIIISEVANQISQTAFLSLHRSGQGLEAPHDLCLVIEGILLSGKTTKLRTIVSGPKETLI